MRTIKTVAGQFAVLFLTFIQTLFAAGAIALPIAILTESGLSFGIYSVAAVLVVLAFAFMVFMISAVPAKIVLKMKGKLASGESSNEVYFNKAEGRLRRRYFKDWAEISVRYTIIWYALGPVAFFLQLIAVIISLLALVIPPLHSQVGRPEYCDYKAEKVQNVLNFLFGFVIGGVSRERKYIQRTN